VSDHRVKVGRLLLLSHGAYSSYARHGWFVAVQDFCPEEMLRRFVEQNKEQKVPYRFDYMKFLGWLTKEAVLVEVEEFFDEWHLGDYGQVSEASFMPRASSSASDEHR